MVFSTSRRKNGVAQFLDTRTDKHQKQKRNPVKKTRFFQAHQKRTGAVVVHGVGMGKCRRQLKKMPVQLHIRTARAD